MELREQLRYHRKLKKISIKQVAEDIGVSTSLISKYENNLCNLSWENIMNYADSVGMKHALIDKNTLDFG